DPDGPFLEPICDVIVGLMAEEGLWALPEVDWSKEWGLEEGLELRKFLQAERRFLVNYETNMAIWKEKLFWIFQGMMGYLPARTFADGNGDGTFTVPLIDLLEKPDEVIERLVVTFFDQDVSEAKLFERVRNQLDRNAKLASGIDPKIETGGRIILPTKVKDKASRELIASYLHATPFEDFLEYPLPFLIPSASRFEHTHILGGTGHGKTQLLQSLINNDLSLVGQGEASICVIDSQGDLINTVSRLSCFSYPPLSDRLILIDPHDTEYPVCLNLFDLGKSRIDRLNPKEREQIINSAVELYEYIFGSLLDAELTQRQGLIFRYLARLMMTIPGATLHTLREVLEYGEKWKPHMGKLTGITRTFFETQFFSPSFSQTKKQILTRLWGILSNPFFERMFAHKESKIDMFEAMQGGKVILVNTAKDLLKKDGSQILGRFVIAMISQSVLERARVTQHARLPCFVYIDEAEEYFDEPMVDLLNQARKFKVGLTFAHQNLDQLTPKLKGTIMANTSIKLAGGVSFKDAQELGREMRCDSEVLLRTKKRQETTEFACFVRNVTPQPLTITVPLGLVERLPRMDDDDYEILIDQNRERYCTPWEEEIPSEVEVPLERQDIQQQVIREGPPPTTTAPLQPVIPEAQTISEKEVAPLSSALAPIPPTLLPPELLPEPTPEISPRTVTITAPPKPKKPKPLHAEPAPLGRGGPEHKYLQGLVKHAGEAQGYRAVIEKHILNGQGKVDVSLERDDETIACEISVTSTPEQELENVRKCLKADYRKVVVLASSAKRLKAMKGHISPNIEPHIENVLFFLPEEFIGYITEQGSTKAQTEKTVRGYKVKVKYSAVDQEEQSARKQAIAKVIAGSVKRLK
ncbi:MAG: type IV secretory system conjugative DNA transfer family protein, partial [Nitrososphaera sp.]|nr:type IV secretory system conjugative DNA transfer family protein [Nitrososphaera sp.]